MNSSSQKKRIGIYEFYVTPFAKGDRSDICQGWKNGSNKIEYIVKCIKLIEAQKMDELLRKEINNAPLYRSTNLLIKYVDVEQSTNNLYIFYSFFNSRSLSQLLTSETKQLNNERKLIFSQNLAKSIYMLHQAKLIHRNLHPGHILISESNSIIFCGVKSIFDLRKGMPSDSIGTPYYKAPEIDKNAYSKQSYDERVDVYSFGVILLKIFTGRLFNWDIKYSEIINNTEILPSIKELIILCLKPEPNERILSNQIIDEKYYKMNNEMIPYKILNKDTLSNYTFKKESLLGEGSFSSVYKVFNEAEKTYFAMKIFKMEIVEQSDKMRELVIGEINLLYSLRGLSFLTNLYEAFYYDSQLYMVIELCEGGTLNSHVTSLSKSNSFLHIDDIKLIGWSIAEGLNKLHERNIVHRDVKPHNILLVKDENNGILGAKICDLGLGKQLKDNFPEFQTICGTSEYWAPEIRRKIEGQDVHLTISVDVFSYGLILYFMIFGQHAFEKRENTNKFYYGIIDVPDEKRVPKELLELVRQCLKPKPEERITLNKIIQNPFFVKSAMADFPNSYSFDINQKNCKKSDLSIGALDKSGKYWIKIYKEEIYKRNDIQKYFIRECDFLFKSKLIPHINQVKDYGKYHNSLALAYDYCNGGSLRDLFDLRLKNKKNTNSPKPMFSLSEIKCVQKCLMEFIDSMHGYNYVHRNINPKHILTILDSNFQIIQVRVGGFRLTKSENLGLTLTICVEDLLFFDPLAYLEGYNEFSDLWCIGLIIYYISFEKMIASDPNTLKAIRDDPNPLISEMETNNSKNIDKSIIDFITSCIKKRPRNKKNTFIFTDKAKVNESQN